MEPEDRKLIERGLSLVEIYLKGRLISRISVSLITAGIAILGFSNVIPYVAVIIKPELSKTIDVQNNLFMTIALILIIVGCLIPIFAKIFNHYKSLYIKDLKKINQIYGLYDVDSFEYDLLRTKNNLSMFDYQISKIEELYFTLLSDDFSFYDRSANEAMKKFGNELSTFNSAMSLRLSPTGMNTYSVPRNIYYTEAFYQISEDISNDCTKLNGSYKTMKTHLDRLQNKNMFRFFA